MRKREQKKEERLNIVTWYSTLYAKQIVITFKLQVFEFDNSERSVDWQARFYASRPF